MPFQADKGSSRAGKDPPVPAEAPLRPTEGPATSKDLLRKLTAEFGIPLVWHMVLSKVGVALACIGAALFEVGVARAIPKAYESPPLSVTIRLEGRGANR